MVLQVDSFTDHHTINPMLPKLGAQPTIQKTENEMTMCYSVHSGLMILGDFQFCQHHITHQLVIV
jgi:hypothetical protein